MSPDPADRRADRRPLDDLPSALIVGRGWLADAVADILIARGARSVRRLDPDQSAWTTSTLRTSLREAIDDAGAVVSCSDAPSSRPRDLGDACDYRVPLVACELTDTGARLQIVTPRAPSAGCVSCDWETRVGRGVIESAADVYLRERVFASVPWRYRHSDADIATLAGFVVVALTDAVRAADASTAADTRALVLDLGDRAVHPHAVRRHFACRRCWPRPSSSVEGHRHHVQDQWASDWASYQAPRSLIELAPTLRALVDRDAGLFDRTWTSGAADRRALAAFLSARGVRPDDTPFMDAALAIAERSRIRDGRRETVATGGFDFNDSRVAESLALMEGLERLVAMDYVDPLRLVHSTYAAVEGVAIDPRTISLFSEEQFREPSFPFRPFEPGAELAWVWGIRIASGEPVLVPADVMNGHPPASTMHATSSGAACHSSLHHAVLNGLYELIERDALMLTWLNQRTCSRIRLGDDDPDPYGLRAAFSSVSCRLTHADMTSPIGVPIMLAALEDDEGPDLFMITMVGGLSRTRVLEKLYREITQFTYQHLTDPARYRLPASTSTDPADVRTLPDHLAFYQDRRKRPLRAFLTESSEERPFAESLPHRELPAIEELRTIIEMLRGAGHDPVAIDCTLPFLRALGLWAVKVVVPGLQPLQVGHGRAGLADPRLSGTPNPWPHPFW